ncbi:MAG: hypothetical protein HQK83_07140, partial [Fibrobacteria bacterium]|nr:hypothetical protein [Fibrobacteria bacterium]
MECFSRGSEWRRWDLHVHTPETKKQDQFLGSTVEEKWSKFYSDISSYVGDGSDPVKAISVVGITDYLSIDNYKKVVSDNKLPSCIELVLPNIEMRMQPISAGKPINIHFIFDPTFADDLDERFFSKLSFSYGETTFSAIKSELVRLGKKADPSLDDTAAHKKGLEQFVISFDSVKNVFNKDHELREHVFIAVSNSTNDGVSGLTSHSEYFETEGEDSQLKMLRQAIYQFVDAVFSATPKDTNFFLGKKESCPPELVINQCGSLKPCIHGSDAHENSNLFEPEQQRYCWIKTDPTFNGLKQIIFEPDERVRISPIKPEKKPNYYVIDHINFVDSDFQDETIFFNDKLNCIIGGKSTGKSILLHNLALTIDKPQVDKKDETSMTRTKVDVSMNVTWADGITSNDNPDSSRKIIYIPQTYLNKLCDVSTEKTEIDTIIQDIVLLNSNAKEAFSTANREISKYKSELHKKLVDLQNAHTAVQNQAEEIKNLGDRTGINAELKKLDQEKKQIAKDYSISEDEVEQYNTSISEISKLNKEIEIINAETTSIKTLASLVEPIIIDDDFSDKTLAEIKKVQQKVISESDQTWGNEKTKLLDSLEEQKESKKGGLEKFQRIKTDLHDKVQSNKAMAELTEKIQIESDKLALYEQYSKEKKEKEQKLSELLGQVVSSMETYKKHHSLFADAVNDNSDLKTDELEFSVEVPFKNDAFIEKVKGIMDTSRKTFKEVISPDTFSPLEYTTDRIK